MEAYNDDGKTTSNFWSSKRNHSNSSSTYSQTSPLNKKKSAKEMSVVSSDQKPETNQRKPLGWKAMPFILGNETFERLGSYGIVANFTMYFMIKYNMSQANTVVLIGVKNGLSNFLTLVGAFLADSYLGKFLTIVLGSFASLLGMMMMTSTAVVPQLSPPSCTDEQRSLGQCIGPNRNQLAFLYLAIFWLALGGGGIRPCSIPFAVDQFDSSTEKGRKGISSFFNWYYTSFTVVLLISTTVVVYVQTINWGWGFAIPTICMFCGVVLLFIGARIYVILMPEGSPFSSIAQVCVVAYKKRRLQLPTNGVVDGVFYDAPLKHTLSSKLPLTSQYRFLNKAAMVEDSEIKPDGGCINPWRLCSIQQVEEVKCLMNIFPIWTSAIIGFLPMQTLPFMVAQAMKMDRHLGPKFEVPPPSISFVNLLVTAMFLPIYDRFIIPTLEKFTKQEGGITLLQRIGLGNVFSIASMVVAGFVEKKRRDSTILHASPYGIAPVSVMWLVPQLVLLGFFETFNLLGFIEFYNKQFPDNMRSIGNSLVFLTVSVTSNFHGLLVTLVHRHTEKHGRPSWLTDATSAGKLDYYFFLIASIGLLNFIFFLFVANRFRYKSSGKAEAESNRDIEKD